MILKQYYLACLAHASYMIADEETRTAAIVDPQRDIDQYVSDAKAHGFRIAHVLLTHFHADFVAGHLELRERTGAEICLGRKASADFAFRPLGDGDTVDFGAVRLQAIETPGHTPEAISILVYDLAEAPSRPRAVLTGDTLFIGDVGRPDLMASIGVTAGELASMLYDSLHGKLLKLPDDTLVYPAHGAGSMCGKNISSETVSTIGAQRRLNYALQPMSREEFMRIVTADQPEAPAYFAYNAKLNRMERPTLEASLRNSLRPLSLAGTLKLQAAGALILDVREPADYEAAHIKGSVNIGLSGKFATWAGTVLNAGRPIVIVAEPPRESEAAMRLGRIGFDLVEGHLEGGAAAFDGRPDLITSTDRITAADLNAMMAAGRETLILDVRTAGEWRSKKIGDSLNIPLNQLGSRIGEVPRGRRLIVHCLSGYRSSIAASILKATGVTDVADLAGGIQAWEKTEAPACPAS